jgi:acetyl esterase/lipase
MPSFQSYLIKPISRVISLKMKPAASVQELRKFTKSISGSPALPKGTASSRITIGEAAAEWLIPAGVSSDSVIMYLHGGAWVMGLDKRHRLLAANIGLASGCRILAVDYRLAPEYPFPAALDDCLAAYRRLLEEGFPPHKIIFAGDSSGANLALASLMSIRDAGDPLPAACVCISPVTDLAGTGRTFYSNSDALLNPGFILSMARHYAGDRDVRMPLISPHYGDFTNLPPLLVQAGEDEILLGDAERLADNARKAGVEVQFDVWESMWHVWHINIPYLPEANKAVAEIGKFIISHKKRTGHSE